MLNNIPLMKNTFNFDVPELFPPNGAKHVFDTLMQWNLYLSFLVALRK